MSEITEVPEVTEITEIPNNQTEADCQSLKEKLDAEMAEKRKKLHPRPEDEEEEKVSMKKKKMTAGKENVSVNKDESDEDGKKRLRSRSRSKSRSHMKSRSKSRSKESGTKSTYSLRPRKNVDYSKEEGMEAESDKSDVSFKPEDSVNGDAEGGNVEMKEPETEDKACDSVAVPQTGEVTETVTDTAKTSEVPLDACSMDVQVDEAEDARKEDEESHDQIDEKALQEEINELKDENIETLKEDYEKYKKEEQELLHHANGSEAHSHPKETALTTDPEKETVNSDEKAEQKEN